MNIIIVTIIIYIMNTAATEGVTDDTSKSACTNKIVGHHDDREYLAITIDVGTLYESTFEQGLSYYRPGNVVPILRSSTARARKLRRAIGDIDCTMNFRRAFDVSERLSKGEILPELIYNCSCRSQCQYCHALLYPRESTIHKSLCCHNDKIDDKCMDILHYPSTTDPARYIYDLWWQKGGNSDILHRYSQVLNTHFSLGVLEYKEKLNHITEGSFRGQFTLEGDIYSYQYPLINSDRSREPSRAQLYIFDPSYSKSLDTSTPIYTEITLHNSLIHLNLTRIHNVDRVRVIELAKHIFNILIQCNRYIEDFRTIAEHTALPRDSTYIICHDPQQLTYNKNFCRIRENGEVAILSNTEIVKPFDIILTKRGGTISQRISYKHHYYDCALFPLFYVYGLGGWNSLRKCKDGSKLTIRDYYIYMLQDRRNDDASIKKTTLALRGGRLYQKFLCIAYIKVEDERLSYFETPKFQQEYRLARQQDLEDAVEAGDYRVRPVGTYLPAIYHGGVRFMRTQFYNACTLTSIFGKPDYFITVTCNTNRSWIHDVSQREGQSPYDRPDHIARGFNEMLLDIYDELLYRHVLGEAIALVAVVEFQSRGLPHVHILLTVRTRD
eukprot:GHVU01016905.1.p1 GENE.GHVU01016905.1~~GHVU01016905.1.p1  ORF type:complete len:611 (-),score=2.81 GHVU01016905.1:100-1932(-)